jgi:hypothetical protein
MRSDSNGGQICQTVKVYSTRLAVARHTPVIFTIGWGPFRLR